MLRAGGSTVEALRDGVKAARAGRRGEARTAFRAVLRQDPFNVAALLWLAYLAEDVRASLAYVARALEANPRNARARSALRWARRRVVAVPPQTSTRRRHRAAPSESPARRPRARREAARLATVGVLFLLLALLGWMFGLTVQAESFVALAPVALVPTSSGLGNAGELPTAAPAAALPSATPVPSSPTWTATARPAATSTAVSPPATPTPSAGPSPTATAPPATPTQTSPVPTPVRVESTPLPAAVPAPASSEVRWIDVDVGRQVLTAYEGDTPVRTVLVSTGLAHTPTPIGQYRIYVKYVYDDMTGPGYFLPDVPYVMYFHRGYSVHGTYWHSNFGQPMSHGCVNLPTPDAEWLFSWADVGTLVNVHS